MGWSRSMRFCSTSVMRPVAVNGLVIEASEYMVCSLAARRFSRSAQPNPSSHKMRPSRATATEMDGTWSAVMRLRMKSRIPSNWSAKRGRRTAEAMQIQGACRNSSNFEWQRPAQAFGITPTREVQKRPAPPCQGEPANFTTAKTKSATRRSPEGRLVRTAVGPRRRRWYSRSHSRRCTRRRRSSEPRQRSSHRSPGCQSRAPRGSAG